MTQHDDRFQKNRFETLAVGATENMTRSHEGGASDVIPPLHLSYLLKFAI